MGKRNKYLSLKYSITIFFVIFSCSCGYISEHSELYRPIDDVGFTEKQISTIKVLARIRNLTKSRLSYIVYNKINSTGPYCLDLRFENSDFHTSMRSLTLHSAIIHDSSSRKDFILLSEKQGDIDIPLKERVNIENKFLSWAAMYSFEKKPFQPLFSDQRILNVILDISASSDENVIRNKLHFNFRAELYEKNFFMPISSILVNM